MTSLILNVRSADGRDFELLVHFQETLALGEACIEKISGRREWRDTRSVLLLIGFDPRLAEPGTPS